MAAPSEYRIYPQAWVSIAQLTAAYAFTAWPIQTDQRDYPWFRPGNAADVINEGIEARAGLNGMTRYVGARNGLLPLAPVTPSMLAYTRSYLLGNNASAIATYSYFDRGANVWRASWVILNAPLLNDTFAPAAGGTRQYNISWLWYADAPDAPELEITITPSDLTPNVSASENYTVTVENIGDAPTYDDIVLQMSLPNAGRWTMTSITATGWNVEYSTNGGSSYSSTPPSPLWTTSNLRLTRTTILNDGSTASVTLNGTVIAAGQLFLRVTADTDGTLQVDEESDLTAS